MADHEARTKRALWPYLHCTDNRHGRFEGERQILELISLGAPLAGILNRLCTAINVQIGDVISLVSLTDEQENHFCSVTQRALQVGLDVFSPTAILSPDQTLLGTLEIYPCEPRRPTPHENELIERVNHLAAIALQRHADEQDFERRSKGPRGWIVAAYERPSFIN